MSAFYSKIFFFFGNQDDSKNTKRNLFKNHPIPIKEEIIESYIFPTKSFYAICMLRAFLDASSFMDARNRLLRSLSFLYRVISPPFSPGQALCWPQLERKKDWLSTWNVSMHMCIHSHRKGGGTRAGFIPLKRDQRGIRCSAPWNENLLENPKHQFAILSSILSMKVS